MKAKLTRRIFATLLVIAMILTLVPAAFASSFSDVPTGAWYDKAVTYCEDNHIMSGVGDGKFNPSGKVPREQSVQALFALDGSHAVPFEALFSDVAEGQWFAKAVTWGAKNGIVAGMSADKFGVGQNVTREQMAAFFFRYANYVKADTSAEGDLSVFPDKDDTSAYAVNAVKWAVGEGIISGVKQNDGSVLLKPKDPLTRAQLAVMMMKFHQLINEKPDLTGKTVILHSNDVHGAIEGYAFMAAQKAYFEACGAEVILADAGDFSQGTTNVSLSKGKNAVDLMNLVGYDVATLGNHEFDYGADQMFDNLSKAEFAVTCADVLKDGAAIYDPYVIIEKGGVKIAFIGLETPEAQTKANPALIQGLTFLSNDTDPAIWAETQKQVDAAKAAGADLVIGLVHLGVDGESMPYRSVDMLQEVTGFDFVIDGHSHTVMENGPQSEPIQSTGTAFKNVGCIVIDNETKAIEDNYLIPTEGLAKDEEVAAAAQEIIDAIAAEYGAKFAVSEVDLNGDKAPNGNRDSETNNGDFITDAMIWSVTEQNPGSITGIPAENIVAITNGGGIRAWIHKGDVTKNDIFTVLPFGNTVAVVYVTGAELLEALEASTYCTPDAVGGFPQIAGMNITIATYEEYDANAETYPGSTYYGPASINRVTIEDINGQPFDPNATYAVVTNNFCAAGGDTYYAFAAASSQFDTGRPLDEVVMDYVTEKLEGVIPASLYEEPQGRITIKTEAEEEGIKGLVIPDGTDMLKYGHIDIDIPADEFLKEFSLGDTVLVDIEGYGTYEVPVCASYDDVAAGEMLLRVVSGKTYLILAINYGQIAVQEGLVELAPEGSATKYIVKEGVTFPINVTITAKPEVKAEGLVIPDGADMLKYGHIDIDIPADEFLQDFAIGDIVSVEIEGYGTYEVPVCASYDDVAAGEMLLRVVSGKTYLILAINYGQIAVQEGLVELAPEGSATKYVVKEGVTFPINVTITKKDSGGGENLIGNLVRTENREEYPELTDAEFANFREVTAGNIRPETLYRSSSPINPEIGRNTYADAAAAEAGVKTFINLADTEAEAAAYPGYAESYYSAQNHIFLGLPVAFTTDTFKSGLAEGFRYIINNEAPYLVHCTEGKDRAGLTAAILECLCGATYEEVLDDYVTTYHNYYSVEGGAQRALTDKEIAAIGDVILANLKLAFGVEITETTDLAAAAEAYMTSIGLTDEEIEQLKIALCGYDEPLRDGDKVAIVLNSNNKAVSTTAYFYEAKGYWQLTPVDVTVEDGIVAYQDGITFEVMHDMDRCYQFIADGKYLTSGETGNNLTLEETPTEYSSWILEATDGGYFLKNKAAQYNGNPQYLEFYTNFTVYGKGATANPENYAFSFYPVAVAPAAEYEGKTVILHSNDVHGAIAGYAYIAGLKADFEAKGAEVILADAGDYSQGTTNVSLSKGANAVDMMNLVGYDVATLGNHEFDYGADQLFANLEKADFAVTCADVLKDGAAIYDPYVIIEKGGVKTAFIGLETPEAQTKANPALIQGLTFLTNETDPTLWANTQAQVDAAKADGADVVIALAHLGVDEGSRPYTSLDLLGAVEGIDFIIDGHSHTVMSVGADGEPIQSTGTAFENVGCIVIDNESKTIVDNYLITVGENTPKDETVAAAAQAIIDEIAEEYGEKFATSEVDLNGDKEPGNRTEETNNGDLITDAMIWCVTEQYPGSIAEVPAENIVAITNGGGIRAWIHKGDVTKNDILTVLPFGNTVAVVYVTGAELLEALEASTFCTPISVGGFPQVAGINFTIDADKAYDPNDATYPGSTYHGPKTINRVTITEVNGKAFDPTAKYAVVTNNFCAGGGDTYYAFAAASSQFDTGYTLDAVVMDYITEKLGGVISAEQYAEPQGRITVKYTPPEDDKITIGGLDADIWMTKYGNVYTDCKATKFTDDLGFEWGDIVTVKFLDKELDLPVVPTYAYVDTGVAAIIMNKSESGDPTGYISLAINMGDFATTYGIATKTTNEDKTWFWTAQEGVEFPIEVTFTMKEEGGYMAEYILHDLNRTNAREDYAALTDAEFANFRQVTTTGMGDHLYRGSSPINPEIGRNTYADAAIEAAGVTVILNLADDKASAEAYAGFSDSYYSKQNVKYLNLGVDFTADDFKAGLAEGLRFFAENEGTYYVHCTEGKDRAGFVNALLECLMGATYDEVVADYMVTYYNYYGVTTDDERYAPIANSNIIKTLCTAFGVEDLATADLAAEAAEYIKGIGLSDDELAALKKNLGNGEAGEKTGYVLSTAAPEVGDKFIVCAKSGDKYYALTCTDVNAVKSAGQEVTVEDGVITSSDANIAWNLVTGKHSTYEGPAMQPVGAETFLHLNSSKIRVAANAQNGILTFAASGDGYTLYADTGSGRYLTFDGSSFGVSADAGATLYFFIYAE